MVELNDIHDTVKTKRKEVFSVRLKHVMKERGITQQELADRIKISRQLISQYVNGKSLPRTETLNRISEALRIRETWLLGYTDMEIPKFDNIIPKHPINEILEKHFIEIELEIKNNYNFIDDEFLKILRRQYLNSLNLNFKGLRKLESYLSDLRQINSYHANALYEFKDPKYK